MLPNFILELSNFTKIDILGEGCFGSVFLIQEKGTEKLFAAKVSKLKCESTTEQKTFFQEISAYSKIKNHAVLSLYGFNLLNFKNEHFPTIITEYMPNGSLGKLIKEHKDFPSSKKYIILLGIAEGMKYLHSLKIIHRDLKPDNVLLDQYFHPHICDFGTAKLSESSFSTLLMESYNGTPLYMAPEVFNDEQYTYKVDVFSFAILAYELITGTFPYPGLKTVFLLQKAVKKGLRPNLSLIQDESIRKLLIKCWSSDPMKRPNFNEIVELIKQESFMKAMKANRKEVEEYLNLFGDKISPNLSLAKEIEYAFQTKGGKLMKKKFLSSMKAGEIINELIKSSTKIDENSFLIYTKRIIDNDSLLTDFIYYDDDDDFYNIEPLIISTEIPKEITVEIKFHINKELYNNYGKFKFIKGTEVYNIAYLAEYFLLISNNIDSIRLEANGTPLNDEDILDEDAVIIVKKC